MRHRICKILCIRKRGVAGVPRAVRGMKDRFAEDAANLANLEAHFASTARRAGFTRVFTPIVERTEVFARPLGISSDIVGKEMYSLEDRSGESLCLRPEGTAGVIRAVLEDNLHLEGVSKLFYSGPMFRYERPQRGRLRQFLQFGIEAIGSESCTTDAEAILLAHDALEGLGVRGQVKLYINSLGSSDDRERYNEKLAAYLEPYRHDLSADSRERLERGSVLRILDSKAAADQSICQDAPKITDALSSTSAQRFARVCEILDTAGCEYHIDSRLARGLDYYTHTIFEFVTSHSSAQNAVLAGGRYDHLPRALGARKLDYLPCFGWAAGLERLQLLREEQEEWESSAAIGPHAAVLVVRQKNEFNTMLESAALEAARALRRSGISASVQYEGEIKKQLPNAVKTGARAAVVIGEDELLAGRFAIKNLVTAEQVSVSGSDLVATIRALLSGQRRA